MLDIKLSIQLNAPNLPIKTSSFVEFIAVSSAQSNNTLFDIIINEEINLQTYCTALITKIFDLPQSKYSDFINYQTDLVKDELNWINKFEKLISRNESLFVTKTALCKYNKLFHILEKKREEIQSMRVRAAHKATPKRLINAEAEDRYFSFHEVKEHIEKLDNFNEKIIHLTEEIYEYKQADIISVNNKLQAYDEQCNQLIEKLQTIRKMKTEFENEKELLENNSNSVNNSKNKLQINGPLNIIAFAFKQMMTNVKPNGKPYLQHKIKDVAQFVCDSFVDEDGQPLSMSTVQTYLSPNRTDKDPNGDVSVKF